jgi:hypothetical protein
MLKNKHVIYVVQLFLTLFSNVKSLVYGTVFVWNPSKNRTMREGDKLSF